MLELYQIFDRKGMSIKGQIIQSEKICVSFWVSSTTDLDWLL